MCVSSHTPARRTPPPSPLHLPMAESHFASLEDQDGVRLTWNVWPQTRLDAAKCVVPLAAVYSPVKALANMPVRVRGGREGGR